VAESPVDPAELQARGLYDPEASDAAERLQLIGYLLEIGATLEDLERAAEGELPGVASMIALRGRPFLTRSEVASRAGVPEELAVRVWRAAGLPDPGPDAQVGTEEDVEALRNLRAGIDLLGFDEMVQLARVVGASLSRVADAMVAAFMVNVAGPSMDEDPTGLTLARANALAGALLRASGATIDYLLRRHIELAQRPLVLGVAETQALTVGFMDLVGSTALARQVSIGELGALLTSFDQLASDVIVDRRPAREAHRRRGDVRCCRPDDPEIALDVTDQLERHPRLPTRAGRSRPGTSSPASATTSARW
jgi:Adenylate cyclase regulatory domain